MNEADKERYFREKEAYERITGQVFPVSKVFEEIVFNLVFFLYIRSLSPPTHQMLCRMLQVPPGESLAHNMPDMRKQHRDMGMFEGASELVAVGQVSGTPSGRTSTAGDKKKYCW